MASLLGFARTGHGQEGPDLQALIRDTQKMTIVRKDTNSQQLTIVWWIPIEFWEVNLKKNPNTTPQMIDKLKATLDPYTLVALVNCDVGPFGGMTFQSDSAVRASVTLSDAQKSSYAPLADAQISADAKVLLAMMRPVVAGALGQLGEHINFVFFAGKAKDGRRIAEPLSDRSFSVFLDGAEFKFRLPVGSLLPPKFDPATREQFPGNYRYSPFTGTELVGDAPAVAAPTPELSGAKPSEPAATAPPK